MKTNFQILLSAGRKFVVLFLLASFAVAAFAISGDGRNARAKQHKLLSTKTSVNPSTFSLRSGYHFRGQEVINLSENKYVNLTTTVTYQQGHTDYTMPVKKKVILNNRVTFNPNASTR